MGISKWVKDLTGQKFNYLLVIKLSDIRTKSGQARWECLCECGNTCCVDGNNLARGGVKSCGCHRHDGIDADRKSKKCPKCNKIVPIDDFPRLKTAKDGHAFYCKSCMSEINKLRYVGSRNDNYKDRRREMHSKWSAERYHTDILYRITILLRTRLFKSLQRNTKSARTLDLLGCSVEFLKGHLESKFTGDISWDNYGSYWHIDHIRPCSSFDLSDEDEQRKCFHYTNLQPLEKIANLSKGAKW